MTRGVLLGSVLALAGAGVAVPAAAATVTVVSYAMPNGSGQASGGTYNYWDRAYTGSGSTTTDGAALSGGTGDLTDGVSASGIWSSVENTAGTGPYVGWRDSTSPNPLITFNFTGSPVITSILIHLDNSNTGGVSAPRTILVDGAPIAYTPPTVGTAGTVTLGGLNLTGNSHTVQFTHSNSWVFVSEVTFMNNASAVPEPASWALMILGFGAVGGAMRVRRRQVRFASV